SGNASDFISRAIEENSSDVVGREGYAKYIALRPRAERMGSHGLFTDEGVAVNLSAVTDEMNRHQGNIWTIIISLRREDAERLGFNTGERWRSMLRSQSAELSKNFKIPMTHLKWYAAFHNESHHPHVHMIVYSSDSREGYLSLMGINNLRSSLANDIFMQDQYCTYEKQTEYRDRLRIDGKKYIADIVEKINTEQAADPQIQALLLQLADKLSKTKGKKVYGYLKPEVKAIVDAIMIKLSENEQVAQLYDLWYQQKENAMKVYSDELPPRIPLVDNKEFKPLKNAIIQEALKISEQEYSDAEQKRDEKVPFLIAENNNEPVSISDDETLTEEENEPDNDDEISDNEDEVTPPEFLPNNDSINNRRNYYAAMGSLRLLRYLARMLQNRIDDQKIKADSRIDRKLYQKIQDKKHAQGLK
ncbi:MAG: MobP3 family relaxase, partial [Acutalibacteraceae bacterium]|nr:MobP3 family relaxase [Acutalibacteraceae bacterium]